MPYVVTTKSVSHDLSGNYKEISQGDFIVKYKGNVEAKQTGGNTYLLQGIIHGKAVSNASETDIELFRQLYIEDSLEELEGFYTGIIIEKNQIQVVRDIFGTKSVYYTQENDKMGLSSMIKPLLQIQSHPPEVNKEIAADYLAYGLVDHRPQTFFRGINRLKPKKRLLYTGEEIHIDEANYPSGNQPEELDQLIEENIEKLKPEEDSYYCPVSGGLDSTITASKCKDAEHIHLSLQHGTKDDRYLPYVKSEYDLDIQKTEVKPAELLEEIEKTVSSQEEPTAFPAMQAQSLLYRNIEDGRTIISGTGADELFYGYSWFLPFFLADKLQEGNILGFFKQLLNYRKSIGLNHLYGVKDILLNGGITLPSEAETLVKYESTPSKIHDLNEARIRHLEDFYFPHMLRSVQKHSREHQVEVRPAFLSKKILAYSSNKEPDEHFQNRLKKYLIRSCFKEQLPERVYLRKQKTGFVKASNSLYNKSTNKKFLEVFQSESFQNRDLINSRKVLRKLKQGKLVFESAYRFYNFEVWMRNFID